MLDQNTDRMWYVIGAVIVGAAIILILNSTFPSLFASIGETFKTKTADVTTVVENTGGELTDGIGPVVRENLIEDGAIERIGSYEFLKTVDLAPLFDKNGLKDTYTLSFELKSANTSKSDQMRIYMQNGEGTKYNFVATQVTVTQDYQTFTIKGLKPSINTGNLVLEKPYKQAYLSFYGTYDTGNNPSVKNIQVYKE